MTASELDRELLVADSFRVRVRGGRAEVRSWSAHVARFAGTVREALASPSAAAAAARTASELSDAFAARGETRIVAARLDLPSGEEDRLSAFLAKATVQIAAAGEGFPRLELWRTPDGGLEYALALRELPPLRDSVELRSAAHVRLPDPRRKGPGIAALSALNRELGAEALLLDPAGQVREGATTSLIYWVDAGSASGHIIADSARVSSVTEALLSSAAGHRLIGVKPDRRRIGAFSLGSPTPVDLQLCEVWAVNALHGIRVVTSIDGVALPAPVPERLRWFQEALDRSWEPVS